MTQDLDSKTQMIAVLLEKVAKLDNHPGADVSKELADIQIALRVLQSQIEAGRVVQGKLNKTQEAINNIITAP